MGGWNEDKYDCIQCHKHKFHESRNCTKFFPEAVKEKPKDIWEAVHRTKSGEPFFPGIKCEECPVSYISQKSLDLIQIDMRQRIAHKATGAFLYGPDLSKWPSKLLDALTVIEDEQRSIENGLYELERNR